MAAPQLSLDLRGRPSAGEVLARIRAESRDQSEKGRWFEQLFMRIALQEPELEVAEIWRWPDWSEREALTGLDGRDIGIDLVALSCETLLARGRRDESPLEHRVSAWALRVPVHRVVAGITRNARIGRKHDFRHSYASRALSLGQSLPMIGKLLCHRKVQTTARYGHLARDSVKAAEERVSDSLQTDMDTPPNVTATA